MQGSGAFRALPLDKGRRCGQFSVGIRMFWVFVCVFRQPLWSGIPLGFGSFCVLGCGSAVVSFRILFFVYLCSASCVGAERRREALSVMCRAGLQSFQACSDDRAILPCGVSVQGLKVTNRISFAQERPTPPLHPATKRRTPRRAIPVPAPASDSCASSILERP